MRARIPRCPQCAKSLPCVKSEHWGTRSRNGSGPTVLIGHYLSINPAAFDVEKTGRTRPSKLMRGRARYPTIERRCRRCEHIWWATS